MVSLTVKNECGPQNHVDGVKSADPDGLSAGEPQRMQFNIVHVFHVSKYISESCSCIILKFSPCCQCKAIHTPEASRALIAPPSNSEQYVQETPF